MANKSLRIQQLAKEHKIRLEDIATKLGITRVSFQQALKRNQFGIDRLSDIADILGVEIPELFESAKPQDIISCPHCGKPLHIQIV